MASTYSLRNTEPEYTEDELNSLTKAELLVLCDELGIGGVSKANLKAEIVAAILNR